MGPVITRLFAPGTIDSLNLKYVVIGARLGDEWIFVRHYARTTWEMPAGHIESGETPDQAAVRELYEEAGVVRSTLRTICDYSVEVQGKVESGRLYEALVEELDGPLEHEIKELLLSNELPRSLTYPEVQTILFEKVNEHFQADKQS